MEHKTIAIGAGWIAHQHAKALQDLGVKIEAVYDVNSEKAARFSDAFGARVVSDPTSAIGHVDMMHLFTPPSHRIEYAKPFMDAHIPIFIEKPIATTMNDALFLYEYSKRTKTTMIVGFNHRYRRGYQLLNDAVASGQLGDPINIYVQRIGTGAGFRQRTLNETWRTDPKLVCGMSIESLSHDINMILPLVNNNIKSISAAVFGTVSTLPTYDNNANIIFRLTNGAIGSIQSSWSSDLNFSVRGYIGTNGTAEIRGNGLWDFETFTMKTGDMSEPIVIDIGEKFSTTAHASYVAINRHFIDCIEGSASPLTPIEDGVNALHFSLAILKSDTEGSAIGWHQPLPLPH